MFEKIPWGWEQGWRGKMVKEQVACRMTPKWESKAAMGSCQLGAATRYTEVGVRAVEWTQSTGMRQGQADAVLKLLRPTGQPALASGQARQGGEASSWKERGQLSEP